MKTTLDLKEILERVVECGPKTWKSDESMADFHVCLGLEDEEETDIAMLILEGLGVLTYRKDFSGVVYPDRASELLMTMERWSRCGDLDRPRSNQERIVDGFNAAVAAGWMPTVPNESKCRKCVRPHLPHHPYCRPCSEIVEKAAADAPAAPPPKVG